MIDVKQAVAAAHNYAAEALNASDLLLEEIVSDDSDNSFRITFSFPNRRPNPLLAGRPSTIGSRYRDREYKVFAVDKQSGEVKGMTMRALADHE